MPTILTQAVLFLSSYSPLLAILALRYYEHVGWRYFFVTVAVLSAVGLRVFMHFVHDLAPHRITPVTTAAKDGDVMSYIVTYLVPFIGFDIKDTRYGISVALLLGVLFVLYVNSNMLFINPLLNFMGYRTFEVEDSDGCIRVLLTKNQSVKTKTEMNVVMIGSYLMLEKREP